MIHEDPDPILHVDPKSDSGDKTKGIHVDLNPILYVDPKLDSCDKTKGIHVDPVYT